MKTITFISDDRCPKCGSDNIEGDHMEVEGQDAWQRVECNDCGFEWVDVYRYHTSKYYEEEE